MLKQNIAFAFASNRRKACSFYVQKTVTIKYFFQKFECQKCGFMGPKQKGKVWQA